MTTHQGYTELPSSINDVKRLYLTATKRQQYAIRQWFRELETILGHPISTPNGVKQATATPVTSVVEKQTS